MQGPGYLHGFGNKLAIVSCESKKAPDLYDGGRGEPPLDNFSFPFISHYSLGGDDMPQVVDLLVEYLIF